MKKLLAFLILTLSLFGSTESKGQSNFVNVEKISLFTDRTVYIAGEKVEFAAYLSTPNGKNNYILSNILYVEIITPEGVKIAKGKFLCQGNLCTGNIPVPNDILTGYYYIKAYTKFMRNFGATAYSYTQLKIINPFKLEVLSYPRAIQTTTDSVRFVNYEKNDELFSFTTDKKDYLTRSKGYIKMEVSDREKKSLKYLNLTIVPEFTFFDSKISFANTKLLNNQFYSPETNGITLTGKVIDSKTQEPLVNALVNLSILGDKDFVANLSDSSGHFYFKMPSLFGSRDIFLCSGSSSNAKPLILVDNDFCNDEIKLLTPTFRLNEKEKNTIYNLALNHQIDALFNSIKQKDSSNFPKAFYGEPTINLILDKYIQLPTVEDYINELIPLLKIRKHHKKKYFKIYNTNSESEMEIYEPLILFDLVAINDPEKILSLSPQSISRIELVDVPYIKGSITYGGIVSFFSKKDDFAGIDLPSSGMFLDFGFLTDTSNYNTSVTTSTNNPDTRNTLLWNPKVSFTNANEISFTTPDTPGTYIILFRGVTDDGKSIIYEKPIVVKE